MKLAAIAVTALLNMISSEGECLAQAQSTNIASRAQILPAPTLSQNAWNSAVRAIPQTSLVLPLAPRVSGKTVINTPVLKTWGSNSLALLSPVRKDSALLKPGVYTTEPYKSIVVVPGKHLDDGAIIAGGVGEIKMPMIQPELRFIPRDAAKK